MRARHLIALARNVKLGLGYGYPLCCVLHYVWDGLWGWPSSMTRWRQIADDPTDPCPWVPCGVLHPGGSPLAPPARVLAIARFNVRHLAPTRSARTRRALVRHGSGRWQQARPDEKRWFAEQSALPRFYWDDAGLDRALDSF
jgi:hypothetical protein